jgi:rhamnogalacturonyl hydrolase YesR
MFSLTPALCILLAGLSSISPTSAQDHPASYAEWAANSAISRGQGNGLNNGQPYVSYDHGEFWWGLQQLYERGGNKSYYDYIVNGVNNVVTPNGTVIGGYKYASSNS